MSDIGFAVKALKAGKKVRRTGWFSEKRDNLLDIYKGEEMIRLCFLGEGYSLEWFPDFEDLLATDWEVVE